MSAFGVGMPKLLQCFVDVEWHGDIDSPVGVIPLKGEAAEKRSISVSRDGVQAAECGDEMVCGDGAGVLDTDIIDDQIKHNGKVGVCPERRHAGDRGKDIFGKVKSEAVVGNDAGFLEARHAFLDV